MDAKLAKEIIERTNLLQPQSNYQMELYFRAKGYLAALEGPEVKELVEALKDAAAVVGEGEYPVTSKIITEALALYKEAIG